MGTGGPCNLGDAQDGVQEANEMLPGEIVDDDTDEKGKRKGVEDKTRNWKIEETGGKIAGWCEKERQNCAMCSDGEVTARKQSDIENIPEAPQVWNDGHRKHNDAFDGDRDVVNVAANTENCDDDEEEWRGNHDAGHVCAKISVFVH